MVQYGLLRPRFVGPATRLLPPFELVASVFLLAGLGIAYVSGVLAGALVVFTVAVGINLARGRSFDCGCRAAGAPSKIGWPIVARNGVLIAMAILVAIAAPPVVALDGLLASGSSSVGAGDAVALFVSSALTVFTLTLLPEALSLHRAIGHRASSAT